MDKEQGLDINLFFRLKKVLKEDPFRNSPPYKKLVEDLSGAYSRRINIQHRLIYQIYKSEKAIIEPIDKSIRVIFSKNINLFFKPIMMIKSAYIFMIFALELFLFQPCVNSSEKVNLVTVEFPYLSDAKQTVIKSFEKKEECIIPDFQKLHDVNFKHNEFFRGESDPEKKIVKDKNFLKKYGVT